MCIHVFLLVYSFLLLMLLYHISERNATKLYCGCGKAEVDLELINIKFLLTFCTFGDIIKKTFSYFAYFQLIHIQTAIIIIAATKENHMKRITISDVAREAAVSISTASKALNDTGNIASDTVRRVIDAAERLGYKPNRAAQLLSGKNKRIGILIPSTPEPVFSLYEAGLNKALASFEEYGFRSTLIKFDVENETSDFVRGLETLAGQIDGLIFICGYRADEYMRDIDRLKIPKVSLQITQDKAFCPSVTVDEICVGRMAANFLSFDCTRAAMIVGDRKSTIHKLNIDGFCAEAERRGMTVSSVVDSIDRYDLAYSAAEKIVDGRAADGIFVSSYIAPAVCRCLCDRGLAGKIKVIGVDIWELTLPCLRDGSLTAAIYQNQPYQAKKAVELLVSMLRHERSEYDNIKIKPELVLESALEYYL